MGTELEVDAICDGETVLIPGIMEHIERAGVHSGDSIAVYPAFMLTESQKDRLVDYSIRLALSMNTKGLINIQYVLHEDDDLYHRGQPAFVPYRAVHQQGNRRADGRSGSPHA